jgi:hypothetical protein
MGRLEISFMGVSIVALVALVIFDIRAKNAALATSNKTQPVNNTLADATVQGPAYLLYNQPWMFSPPVGNIMPSVTAGQAGQMITQSPAPTSAAQLCSTCG